MEAGGWVSQIEEIFPPTCEATCELSTPFSDNPDCSTCRGGKYRLTRQEHLWICNEKADAWSHDFALCSSLILYYLATLHSVHVFSSSPSEVSWFMLLNINKHGDSNAVCTLSNLPTSPTRPSCLRLNVWTRLPPVCSYPLCLDLVICARHFNKSK